jgi:glycosyltransferase involved in cell wall biosynthesis
MFFSILVANYNNGHLFKECYKSIVNQTYTDWEIIIVDDCSTDDSISIIKSLINQDNRFKLIINDKNKGCGFTKKRCIDNASGVWCGFVDPDDLLFPDALETMSKEIAKNNDFVAFFSDYVCANEKLRGKCMTKHTHEKVVDYLYAPYSCHHFFVFNRSAYLKTVGIDSVAKRAIDQDLYLNLTKQGYFNYVNKILYVYRTHKGSISLNNNELKAKAWSIKIVMNHCERRGVNFEDIIPLHLGKLNSINIISCLKNLLYQITKGYYNKICAIRKMREFRKWFNSL